MGWGGTVRGRDTHDVAGLGGRGLVTQLPVETDEVGEGGVPGEGVGGAEESQQHLLEEDRRGNALHAAHRHMGELWRGGATTGHRVRKVIQSIQEGVCTVSRSERENSRTFTKTEHPTVHFSQAQITTRGKRKILKRPYFQYVSKGASGLLPFA